MSNKVGRPRVPKEKAQAVLYGARVSPLEAKQINRNLDESGQTASLVIKKALRDAARPRWTVSKWKYEDLQDKTVEFCFRVPRSGGVMTHEGWGRFLVYRHAWDASKLAIQIQIILPEGRGVRSITFYLAQPSVDAIERHPNPKVADFRCFEKS